VAGDSALFREGLRDVQRNRLCVGKRNVGHHGDDKPAFGKRHERDVVPPMNSPLLPWPPSASVVPEGQRLEIPAKTVPGLRARGEPLRRLEPLDGVGLQQLAVVNAHSEPHETAWTGTQRRAHSCALKLGNSVVVMSGQRAPALPVFTTAADAERALVHDSGRG
jgi:hypothetical protein